MRTTIAAVIFGLLLAGSGSTVAQTSAADQKLIMGLATDLAAAERRIAALEKTVNASAFAINDMDKRLAKLESR